MRKLSCHPHHSQPLLPRSKLQVQTTMFIQRMQTQTLGGLPHHQHRMLLSRLLRTPLLWQQWVLRHTLITTIVGTRQSSMNRWTLLLC